MSRGWARIFRRRRKAGRVTWLSRLQAVKVTHSRVRSALAPTLQAGPHNQLVRAGRGPFTGRLPNRHARHHQELRTPRG